MKHLQTFTVLSFLIFSMGSCQKESKTLATEEINATNLTKNLSSNSNEDAARNADSKHVYTLTNQVSGNAVMDYNRSSDGMLTFNASYATGGTGTGGGLGNQDAIILSGGEDDEDDNTLLAVNPGSNSISSFKINSNGLQLKSTVSSGGMRPVSIAQHNDIVYVLNAGGAGNISGFTLKDNRLMPILNSTRPLSTTAAGAAQVAFVNDGSVLVVTEKATNKIITFTISASGNPGIMHSITSANPTPFGFATGKHGNIFVSEAAGGAPGASTVSSYHVSNNGVISLITGPIGANQSAACWVVITQNGKYAYTTNTASNNISTYNVNVNNGGVTLNTAIASTTGAGPIDAALNNNSKYLYILNAGSHTIGVYGVANNGGLNLVQTVSGVPIGATGLAAR